MIGSSEGERASEREKDKVRERQRTETRTETRTERASERERVCVCCAMTPSVAANPTKRSRPTSGKETRGTLDRSAKRKARSGSVGVGNGDAKNGSGKISFRGNGRESRITSKWEKEVEKEETALEETRVEGGEPGSGVNRLLTEFCFEDASGNLVPLESFDLHEDGVFFSGSIYPLSALGRGSSKPLDREQGRRVGKLGPLPLVTSWSIKGFNGENATGGRQGTTSILVETKNAKYLLNKPVASYRR